MEFPEASRHFSDPIRPAPRRRVGWDGAGRGRGRPPKPAPLFGGSSAAHPRCGSQTLSQSALPFTICITIDPEVACVSPLPGHGTNTGNLNTTRSQRLRVRSNSPLSIRAEKGQRRLGPGAPQRLTSSGSSSGRWACKRSRDPRRLLRAAGTRFCWERGQGRHPEEGMEKLM